MRKDTRTFITVHDGMPEHPKVAPLSDGAFRHLVELWCYCSRNLSDGFVPEAIVMRLTRPKTRRELRSAGLMEPVDGGVHMHDYLEHQRSKAQVEDLTQKRREAGSRGGRARAQRQASATANAKHDGGKSQPETETETEPSPSGEGTSEVADTPPDTPRTDVEGLCTLLADLVEANGIKRPRITKRWRDAARLLLDRDGYTVEQVQWMARWATSHEFWRANVLSMPTLRERFDQLKLQATAGRSKSDRRSPAEDAAATVALGERMQAEQDRRLLGAS